MFSKVLIAVDDSGCSERAGRIGLEFAQKLGTRAVVAHILKAPPTYLGLGVPAATLEAYARELLRPWEELGQQMKLELHTEYLRDEDIGEGIVFAAGRSGCDLIVLGTHGREGLSRMFLGSVAERVSRLSPMPVMLVRGDGKVEPSTGLFKRILAPVDGSEAGQPAFALADYLATRLGAELQVLHVTPRMPLPLGDPWGGSVMIYNWEDTQRILEQEGKAILDAARIKVKTPRVSIEMTQANTRREADVIVEYARQHQSDLIVMGTHGRTGLEYLLLGSVAEGVAHHAPVPLLLIRPTPVEARPVPEAVASTAR